MLQSISGFDRPVGRIAAGVSLRSERAEPALGAGFQSIFPGGIALFVMDTRPCIAIALPVCRLGLVEVIPWDGFWGDSGMKLAFQLIACWVAFSCVVGPVLTWAFFRADRLTRDNAEPDDIDAPSLSIV